MYQMSLFATRQPFFFPWRCDRKPLRVLHIENRLCLAGSCQGIALGYRTIAACMTGLSSTGKTGSLCAKKLSLRWAQFLLAVLKIQVIRNEFI